MTTTQADVDRIVISAEDLRAELGAGGDVVVLEVRRDAAAPGSTRIPGARRVSVTADLVGSSTPASGSLPLPTAEQIQDVIRRWGINAHSLVVAYSPEHPALAARAWWTLKWAGVPDVRVLDDDGTRLGTVVERAVDGRDTGAGTFTVRIGSLPTLDTQQAAALARSGVLLDARAATAYTGESGGGHIPGAISLPAGALVRGEGRLNDDVQQRAQYAALGVDGDTPVGAYCGGGTSATLTVLSLAKLGISAALYPGSFSAYSADGNRPVAVGSERG